MDDVIAFMNDFLAKDYEARKAVYVEPDDAVFETKVRAADGFFDPHTGGGIGRAPGFGATSKDPLIAAAKSRTLASLQPRILFLIRKYQHAAWVDLYRCYVDSGMIANRTSYLESLFVTRDAKKLVIITRWGICLTCLGTGRTDGTDCYNCGGLGWEPAGGKSLGELGSLLEVRRLHAPTEMLSLSDYEKD